MSKKLPKLAIVGRPNVGKSALFNRICKKKIAIVDEAEGITRDRIYAESEIFGMPFEVIDTGGIDSRSKAIFNEQIKQQAEIAIEEADTIIMVVDSRTGITELDKEVARVLHRTQKPLCLAVNKIDNINEEHLIYQFQTLGIKQMIPVSAAQNWHVAELLEAAFANFDKAGIEEDTNPAINITIVGRPNVGKSSLVNYLLDEERVIVSPIAGTTRDSIDVSFTHGDEIYTLVDTAGIRRKGAEHEVVDKFAAIRTQRAIERSDICLLMLDAQQGITREEKKIANMIEEQGKGCILLFNKWDLVKGFRMEHCLKGIEEEVPFLKHCPKLFISATTGRNVDKIFDVVKEVHAESQKRITTHQLNKFIADSMQRNHPPMLQGKRLRIYYMAQVGVQPPKFILFVNFPNLMTDAYKKYLYNQFREIYGFTGVPLEIHLKGKKRDKRPEHNPNKHPGENSDIAQGYPHPKADAEHDYEDFKEEDQANEVFEDFEDLPGHMESWNEEQ